MLRVFKNFLKEEDGLGTVEIVIIIAVLVAIALIFRRAIFGFVTRIIDAIFGKGVEDEIKSGLPSAKPS